MNYQSKLYSLGLTASYTGTAGMTPLEDLREFLTGVEGHLGTEVKHEKH